MGRSRHQTEKPLPHWQARPLLVLAAAFGMGIFLGIGAAPGWYLMGGLAGGAAFAVMAARFKVPWALAACVLIFFAGFARGSLAAHPFRPAEGTYTVSARVEGKSVLRDTGQVACALRDVTLLETGERLAKCYWTYYLREGEGDPGFTDGDALTFQARLYHPQGQVNPYGFDFERYLLQKGITCGLYGFRQGRVEKGEAGQQYRLRESLLKRLNQCIGEESGLAAALLLGERDLMDEETTVSFRRCGVAHLLAVSGLHVGILVMFLNWALGGLKTPAKLHYALLALFLLGYAWLIGFTATVTRAALLALISSGQRIVRRRADPLTSLAAAFFMILAVQPMDLTAPGFVMSFSAVAGIVLIAGRLEEGKWIKRLQRLPGLKSLPVSLGAQAGTLLPVMAYYQELPVLGVLFNLAAIPYTMMLMAVYLGTLFLSFVGPAGMWLGKLAALMTQGFTDSAAWLSRFSFVVLPTGTPAPLVIGAGAMALYAVSRFVRCGPRARCALLTACAVIGAGGAWLDRHAQIRYTQFSLGQADGAIVEDGGRTMVIDAGERGGDLAAYLRARNLGADILIFTHLHTDHMAGAQDLIDKNIPIGVCYIPEGGERALADAKCREILARLREMGVPILTCARGDTLALKNVHAEVVWPERGRVRPGQDANPSSLCLSIQGGGASILTTGDLTGDYEMYAAVKADILKVAHHGSGASTSLAFLEAAAPSLALISCGKDRSLPSERVLETLEASGVPYWRTDQAGAVTVLMGNGEARAWAYLD